MILIINIDINNIDNNVVIDTDKAFNTIDIAVDYQYR